MPRKKGTSVKDLWVPARKEVKGTRVKFVVDFRDKDKPKKQQRYHANMSYDAHNKLFYLSDWEQRKVADGKNNATKFNYEVYRGDGDMAWAEASFTYRLKYDNEERIFIEKFGAEVLRTDYIPTKIEPTTGEPVGWDEITIAEPTATDIISLNYELEEFCQEWYRRYLQDPKKIAFKTGIPLFGQDSIIRQVLDYSPNQKVLIEDIIQLYVDFKKLKDRSKQRRNNRKYMEHFSAFCKAKYIHQVDDTKVIKYKAKLKTEIEENDTVNQLNATINKYTIGINAILSFYVNNYLELAQIHDLDNKEIARKKVEEVKKIHNLTRTILKKQKREKVKDKPQPISPNAFKRLINKGIDNGDQQGLLMALLLSNGGLYNMDLSDIRVSHLNTSFDSNGKQFYYLDFPRSKNDVDRITVLWDITHRLLVEQIRYNEEKGLYDGIKNDEEKAIFYTLNKNNPKPANDNNTRYIYNHCFGTDNLHDNGKKLGIRHFRDTLKRASKEAKIDRTYIRTAIGHTQGDSMMDECYDHVTPVDMIQVRDCMAEYYKDGLDLVRNSLAKSK